MITGFLCNGIIPLQCHDVLVFVSELYSVKRFLCYVSWVHKYLVTLLVLTYVAVRKSGVEQQEIIVVTTAG